MNPAFESTRSYDSPCRTSKHFCIWFSFGISPTFDHWGPVYMVCLCELKEQECRLKSNTSEDYLGHTFLPWHKGSLQTHSAAPLPRTTHVPLTEHKEVKLLMGLRCRFAESNPLSWQQPGLLNFHGTPLADNSFEWNPVPPLEDLPGDKRWPSSWDSISPIVRNPHSDHLHMFRKVSTALGFSTSPKCSPQHQSSLCPFSLYPIPSTWSPHSSPHLPLKSLLFLPHREVQLSTLDPSSLPNFSGSTSCSLVIIYLIAIIHI